MKGVLLACTILRAIRNSVNANFCLAFAKRIIDFRRNSGYSILCRAEKTAHMLYRRFLNRVIVDKRGTSGCVRYQRYTRRLYPPSIPLVN